IGRLGPRPTLIEWDTDVPVLDVLLGEAMWADMLTASIMFNRRQVARQAEAAKPRPMSLTPFESVGTSMPVLAAFAAAKAGAAVPVALTPMEGGYDVAA
ncbi:MAG: DUF692 domain-containing protein, partial [Mesorhizobium sp.]